jgi:hypothetical protein
MQRYVTLSWLQEFGYPVNLAGLNQAVNERGKMRVGIELDVHAKRLAERAQMGPATRITGRSGVIR